MSCNSCCNCYEQADGSIVKRTESNGTFEYTLQDLSVSSVAPADFTSANKVDCTKFDLAVMPPKTIQVLEEVCGDKQTGVLVQVVELADGTIEYVNLSTQAPYVASGADCELHTSEDTDYNERTITLCDEGVDVIVTTIYKDGDITDVVSTSTTTLAGTPHVLSGNEKLGACSGLVEVDKELACFKEIGNVDALTTRGYIKFTTNSAVSPSVTTTEYFDKDDVLLDKALFAQVDCC